MEDVLEAAVDRIASPVKNPTADTILKIEVGKRVPSSEVESTLRSTPIEIPSTVNQKEAKSVSESATVASTAVATGKTPEILVLPMQPSQTSNSNITNSLFNSISTITNLTSNRSDDTYNNQVANNITTINDMLTKLIVDKKTETANSVVNSEKVKVLEKSFSNLVGVAAEVKERGSELTESQMILKQLNPEFYNQTVEYSKSINNLKETASETIKGSERLLKESTDQLVNIKNTKLVESASVKNILAPDKSIERSVGKLSKEMSTAVNNLSSSVTSIAPQTSTATSIVNEGSRIDQSSNTTINKPSQPQRVQEAMPASQAAAPGQQLNDFYLQAIYTALISGKVKAKIEY
jgi:hypothetical protein